MTDMTIEQFFEAANNLDSGFAVYDKDLNLIYGNKEIKVHLPVLMDALAQGSPFVDALNKQIDSVAPDISQADRNAIIDTALKGMETGKEFETIGTGERPVLLRQRARPNQNF